MCEIDLMAIQSDFKNILTSSVMQNEKSQNVILYIMIYFSKIRTNLESVKCLIVLYLPHKNRAGLKYTTEYYRKVVSTNYN